MKKNDIKKELKAKLKLDDNTITIINDVFENHFIIGKNNKIKIINDLKDRLNIDDLKADNIYNTFMNIIGNGFKEKLKHPFKSKED
jgi:hypothetical protein